MYICLKIYVKVNEKKSVKISRRLFQKQNPCYGGGKQGLAKAEWRNV